MDIFSLSGQTAFVTGAGSGIGQRLAVGLAEAGADVGCFGLPTSPGLDGTVESINKLGRRAVALRGNVSDARSLEAAVAATQRQLGLLTIGVNCAGIANLAPAESMPVEQWQRMLDVNLTGVFLSAQAQAKAMLPRGRGSIINIASMSGAIVNLGIPQAHYNTAKAGVIHLTRSLATEWSDRGLRVNAISPGYTLTPMNLRPEVDKRRQQWAADTPMGRMASVDKMVGPAVFLASQASSFCTGIDLVVDGGFSCW